MQGEQKSLCKINLEKSDVKRIQSNMPRATGPVAAKLTEFLRLKLPMAYGPLQTSLFGFQYSLLFNHATLTPLQCFWTCGSFAQNFLFLFFHRAGSFSSFRSWFKYHLLKQAFLEFCVWTWDFKITSPCITLYHLIKSPSMRESIQFLLTGQKMAAGVCTLLCFIPKPRMEPCTQVSLTYWWT